MLVATNQSRTEISKRAQIRLAQSAYNQRFALQQIAHRAQRQLSARRLRNLALQSALLALRQQIVLRQMYALRSVLRLKLRALRLRLRVLRLRRVSRLHLALQNSSL